VLLLFLLYMDLWLKCRLHNQRYSLGVGVAVSVNTILPSALGHHSAHAIVVLALAQ
jgi:hypothetical protein